MPAKAKIQHSRPSRPRLATRRETLKLVLESNIHLAGSVYSTTAWQIHKLRTIDLSLPVPDLLACPSRNRRRHPRRATPAFLLLSVHPQTQYNSPTAALICLAAVSSQLFLQLASSTTNFDAQAESGAFFALAGPALGCFGLLWAQPRTRPAI